MTTSTSGRLRSAMPAGPRRRSPLWSPALSVAAAVGCGEALPIGDALVEWLRVAPAEARPPAAPVNDGGSAQVDAGLSSVCTADAFEPNDEPGAASPIGARRDFDARLCDADIDYFRFAAPAAAGTQFSVRVRFDAALGDIDLALTSAADGTLIAESSSVIGEEVVAAVSDGAEYLLEVALFEPGAAAGTPYAVELLVAADATNDCCAKSAAPGCGDAAVRECVCAADPYCCLASFDAYCVGLGVSECGSQCSGPANPGSCCSESSGSGCGDSRIQACVCGLAPFCCSGPYDGTCVSLASGACGGECEEVAR